MDKEKLLRLARDLDVDEKLYNADKRVLVRAIQQALGQEPCYQTDYRYHCETECKWVDCKKLVASWLR